MKLSNVNLAEIKGKAILFGFSLETGDLTSVALTERTDDAAPSLAGWLKSGPDDSETEEFKLADGWAWLSVNAPGFGKVAIADIEFNAAGKIVKLQEV